MKASVLVFLLGFLLAANAADVNLNRASFPKGFIFGTATSAYQVEGAAKLYGRGPSIWDVFVLTPGRIQQNATGDVAVDEYHRFKEDIDLMAELNMDAYRFSISWSRIFPEGKGKVNKRGVAYYNRLIDYMLLKGLQPYANLNHYDLPQSLETEYEGWLSRKVVKDFTNFAEFCFKTYGDRVKHWTTFNEPRVVAQLGYDNGQFAPGRCSAPYGNCTQGNSATEPYIVAHNLLLSHGSAAQVYRKRYQEEQKGSIGILLDFVYSEPYSNSSEDAEAAQRARDFNVGWFLEPIINGSYPKTMQENVGSRLPVFSNDDIAMVKGSVDFVGINHYTTYYVKDASSQTRNTTDYYQDMKIQMLQERDGVPIGPRAHSTWLYIVPWGMYKAVSYIKERYGNPKVVLSENGMDDAANLTLSQSIHDTTRINYYKSYMVNLAAAIRDGANVHGYFAWSLLDNFEWLSGYTSRFGLVYIDFQHRSLKRIPKDSAMWFKKLLNVKRSQEEISLVAQLIRSRGAAKDLSEARRLHSRILTDSPQLCANRFVSNLLVEMYGKCGSVRDARAVFDGIFDPNSFSFTMMISSLAHNARVDEARAFFFRMEGRDVIPWTAVMSAYASAGDLVQAKRFFDLMPQRSIVSWNAMLHALAVSGDFSSAVDIYTCIPEKNIVSSNIILKALSQSGSVDDAMVLFQHMDTRDVVSWTSLLDVNAAAGHLENLRHILCLMPHCDVVAWTTVLLAFAEAGSLEDARKLHENMPKRDSVAWNAMVQAYSQRGHLDEARVMYDRTPMHDVVSATLMLSAYSQHGRVLEAQRVFRSMKDTNVVSWNALIQTYIHVGDLEAAKKSFREMDQRDVVSWNAMIAAFARDDLDHHQQQQQLQQLEIARSFFDRMPQRNVISWNTIMTVVASTGLLEETLEIFASMPQRSLVSWNAMIQGYARNGHIDSAQRTFDLIPWRDVYSWNLIIATYTMVKKLDQATKLFLEMPEANLVAQTSMISAYAHNGHLTIARELFDSLKHRNLLAWTTMLTGYAQRGFTHEALELFNLMALEGIEPDELAFTAVLTAHSHVGLLKWGLECFRSMISDRKVRPVLQHYHSMIDLLGRAGEIEEAENLIKSMPFLPDDVSWTILLGACRVHRDSKRAKEIADLIVNVDPAKGASYVLLSHAVVDETSQTLSHPTCNK